MYYDLKVLIREPFHNTLLGQNLALDYDVHMILA